MTGSQSARLNVDDDDEDDDGDDDDGGEREG